MSSPNTAQDEWQTAQSYGDGDLAGKMLPASQLNRQHLAIPAQTSYHRPSLDGTYSEFSELSVNSDQVHHGHHPLLSSHPDHDRRRVAPLSPERSHRRRGVWGYIDAFWLRNKGVVLVLLAMVFGSGMNVAARLMETDGSHGKGMHPFQILFARMSITVLLSLIYGYYTHISHFPFGVKEVRFLLICRGVGGFFGVFGLYSSLLYLPLAEATVLTFLAPILTCYACSFLIKGETFGRQQQIAGFLSLVGVVFIARPRGLFGGSHPSSFNDGSGTPSSIPSNATSVVSISRSSSADPNLTPTQQHQHLLAVLFAMVGVLGATTAMTTIRKIGTRAHPLISVNYFSSWCTIVSLVAVFAFPSVGFRLPGNLQEWGLLILLGVFGFVMQFLLTAGLSYGGPASVSGSNTSVRLPADAYPRQNEDHVGVNHDTVFGDAEIGDTTNAGEREFPTRSTSAMATAAAMKGSGTRATSMLYTQMLFALAFDKLIWGLSPGWSSWVGSVIILACAVWVAAARDSQRKKASVKDGVDGDTEDDRVSGGISLGKVRNENMDQEEQGLMDSFPDVPDVELEEQDAEEEESNDEGVAERPQSSSKNSPPSPSANIEHGLLP